jgi:hypothetical protein
MSKSTLHDEYVAVRPTHIPYYQQTPLYYQADDGTWELYKDKDEQLGAERMEQERHPQLFIRVADREAASVEAQRAFNRVLEKSLESNDMHQVQASLTGIAQETLDEPRSGPCVRPAVPWRFWRAPHCATPPFCISCSPSLLLTTAPPCTA